MTFKQITSGVLTVLSVAAAIAAGLCLVGMVAIVFAHVLLRRFWGISPAWANELAQLLMVYFSLLGSAFAYRSDLHIGVKFIRNRVSGCVGRIWDVLLDLMAGGFGLALVIWGLDLIVSLPEQTLPGTGLEVMWQYLPVPIGGALIVLFAVEKIVLGREESDGPEAAMETTA
ncbi:MAG: TRAP transporter small permease [Phycisphaerae bacterium]